MRARERSGRLPDAGLQLRGERLGALGCVDDAGHAMYLQAGRGLARAEGKPRVVLDLGTLSLRLKIKVKVKVKVRFGVRLS